MKRVSLLLVLSAMLVMTGCALQPTHDSKVGGTISAVNQGNVNQALERLESDISTSDKVEILFNLDKGELLRIVVRYEESLSAFGAADAKVNAWEAMARSEPEKLLSSGMATFMGDGSRPYEGQDYEKVMLTTRMAMNRINLRDLDNARVDVKRTHEREAVIQEFRAKETVAAEEVAKKEGVTGEAKELNGYPIETLNDPEVLALKNGYQNALSHYLAGFVYEALNEPGLAAPGYRKAIELRPGTPALEEGLAGLDQRTSRARPAGVTDVLFVIEAGNAPARQSKRITFPIPTRKGLIIVPVAYPVIEPNKSPFTLTAISVGDKAYPAALITDFNVMARRALKDEMPGIQLRAAIRAITKGAIQAVLNEKGGWVGLIGNIAAVVTEPNADDRMWRTLPERVFIVRAFVPPGTYDFRIPGLADGVNKLTVDGRHMVVPIRVLETRTYYGQTAQFGTVPQVAKVEPAPTAPTATTATKGAGSPSAKSTKPVTKTSKTVTDLKTTATGTSDTAAGSAKAASGATKAAGADPKAAPGATKASAADAKTAAGATKASATDAKTAAGATNAVAADTKATSGAAKGTAADPKIASGPAKAAPAKSATDSAKGTSTDPTATPVAAK